VEGLRVALGKMQQPDHPGCPLDQGADRPTVVAADDQVAFPMARFGPVGGVEGSLVDGQHRLGEPGPWLLSLLLRSAVITPGA